MQALDGVRTLVPDEALRLARQIAEAIEAAHEKGIIHRDLKPGNVKITSDGRVKVLDFGLAKIKQPITAGVNRFTASSDELKSGPSHSEQTPDVPTLLENVHSTTPGSIMGTPAYISPEQARGQEVDRRTDIWAFGCCLYECLAGRKPFRGETITDLMAEVLKSDPDWSHLGQYASSVEGRLTDALREVEARAKETYVPSWSMAFAHASVGDLELDPMPINHLRYSTFLVQIGQLDEAIAYLKKQISMDPSFAWYHASLGQAYIEKGMGAEAVAALEKVESLGLATGNIGPVLAKAYTLAGRMNDARKTLVQVQELQRQGADWRASIAQIHHALGDDESALSMLEQVVADRLGGLA